MFLQSGNLCQIISRDLGTGYSNLKCLKMARCNLSEIDGLGSLTGLKELYLAFNQITSLDAISMLENLEILDIERLVYSLNFRNLVSDLLQIEYLVYCPNLKSLTILDNPINYDSVLQESEKSADILVRNRHIVSTLIPQLEILDDVPLDNIQLAIIKENLQESCNPITKIQIKSDEVDHDSINRPKSVASIKKPVPPSKFYF